MPSIRTKRVFSVLFLAVKIIVAVLFIGLIILVFYFYSNKDEIANDIINSSNDYLKGEFVFEDMQISPLAQFPNLSFSLNDVSLFAHKSASRESSEKAIINLEKVHLEINLIGLIRNKIQITGLHLRDGTLNFIQEADSSLNISNAFQIPNKSESNKKTENNKVVLDIDNFSFKDINAEYYSWVSRKEIKLNIDDALINFTVNSNIINLLLDSKVTIEKLAVLDVLDAENRELEIETSLRIDRKDSIILLNKAWLNIEDALFNLGGNFRFGKDKKLDLQFSLADNGLSVTKLFLTKKGYKRIKKGDAFIEGSILYDFEENNPIIKGTFGLNDISLSIPETNKTIQTLNMKGSFDSGIENDFSKAIIRCDTVYATTEKGFIKGHFSIEDLYFPEVESKLNVKLNIENYDRLFKIDFLNDISGEVAINTNFKIKKSKDSTWIHEGDNQFFVQLNDVQLSIPNLSADTINQSKISRFLTQNKYFNKLQGEVLLNGELQHDFLDKIPQINLEYELHDLSLQIVKTTQSINKMNMSGAFNSGLKDDFSDAHLLCSNFNIPIDKGIVDGNLDLVSFTLLKIKTQLNAKLDINNYDEIFKIDFLKDLKGEMEMNLNLEGEKLKDSTWTFLPDENLSLTFNEVSFIVPFLQARGALEGKLSGTYDSLKVNELKVLVGNTDLLLNGDIINATSLIKSKKNVFARNLHVRSNRFDLPELVEWLPNSRSGFRDRFRYNIVNIDLKTDGRFIRDADTKGVNEPFLLFDIATCSAKIDSFLPPVKLTDVELDIAKPDSVITAVDIKQFSASFNNDSLDGECIIYANKNKTGTVKFDVDVDSLNPVDIFSYYKPDSAQSKGITKVNGRIAADLKYAGLDTTNNFKSLFFELDDFEFLYPKDTIHCKKLTADFTPVVFDKKRKPAPFSSLSSYVTLTIDQLLSNKGYIKQLYAKAEIKDGVYFVTELKNSTLLQNSSGEFVFAPFVENPYFNIDYSLSNFEFDKLFESMHLDPVVSGFMDAEFHLSAMGSTWDEIYKNLNGQVTLDGENLMLQGINLDDVIWKMSRRQNFNLVDVAGVVVSGPIGLAVTKGAQTVNILITNKNDSTFLPQIYSDYSIKNGVINIEDVAFSTEKNRIAVKGKLDLQTDSLGIIVAIVDKNGRMKWQQSISGTREKPKLNEVYPIATLLLPVDNLIKDIFGIERKQFYDGRVVHPVQKNQPDEHPNPE